jgi:hypothetical protein
MLKTLSLSTVLLAFGVLATPSLAAPATGLKGVESQASSSLTEQVAYRRCWYHHGHRHCRWVGGYGPSVSLHFGGHRHGHRHHRRHYRHY